jgi:Fur family ferric uptake transcriptional regulator
MDALNILRSKGLKKTAQRIMIINILQAKGSSLSENEIRTDMGAMYDRITFYRTVRKLIEMNIIYRILVDNVTVKYTLNSPKETELQNPARFLCRKCGSTTYIEDCPTPEIQLPEGYVALEYEISVTGICSSCASNE